MTQRIPGFHKGRDNELVCFELHDSETTTKLYSPTPDEIADALRNHGVPVTGVMKLILDQDPGVHTVIIDVPVYLAGLEEKGTT